MSLRGILEIWTPGLFLPLPDLLFGIFTGVIGHLWQQGGIVEAIQGSSRAWIFQLGGWYFIRPRSFLYWYSLCIQPLEAYSIFLQHFVAAPILLLDPSIEHSKSTSSLYQVLLFMNKIISEVFWACLSHCWSCIWLRYVPLRYLLVYCCNTHWIHQHKP